jgi:hypothetical protein
MLIDPPNKANAQEKFNTKIFPGLRLDPAPALHRPKTAAPPSAGNSLLCLPRSPPDLGVSFVGSSFDSTRAGAGYVATGPRNDLLLCRSVLLGAASNNAAELDSRTPQTTVWICFNSFHPNPDPLSFSLSTTSMPLTLALVVGRPSRILIPSPPSNPP